jgi:DNA recombination protein RmuC
MIIPLLLTSLISALIAATLGWVISHSRTKTKMEGLVRASEADAAAAKALEEEVRRQNDLTKTDLIALQEQFREAEKGKVSAETHAQESEKNLAEQKALLEEAKAKLSDTFRALAAEALAGNNTSFLTLAQEKFKTVKEEAAVDLDNRKKAVDALIGPLSETLLVYQKETRALEERLLREQGAVSEQLKASALTQAALQSETTKLAQALKPHQVRGRWGEITLRRTVELAGMSSHCDFVEQESIDTDHGRLRPDMVIKLPMGREIVVDSKVPLSGFLEALEVKTEEERTAALTKYARQVHQRVTELSSKEYWTQFSSSPEFVVLFMPNDSFLSAAVERDSSLMESAITKKVVIATPITLIALLHAIAYGWRQQQVAENAQQISALAQDLSDRVATFVEYLQKVGGAMGKAVESYNAAVASFETRILPSARKFKALGANGKKEIETIAPIGQIPRLTSALADAPLKEKD